MIQNNLETYQMHWTSNIIFDQSDSLFVMNEPTTRNPQHLHVIKRASDLLLIWVQDVSRCMAVL